MSTFTSADHAHMAHALRLARKGLYSARPNPRVGCVLVRDGAVVGTGWHRMAGAAHAEINALDAAGEGACGSTAYVTLEPCAHHGRTGPCADALLAAGVAEVVAAMDDPNPQVAGSGFERLRQAGVEVRVGLMQAQAAALNAGFVCRMTRGRPFVRLKIAASLDGGTAMSSGESRWISGDAARRDVQRLRAASGAIMTGIATATDDDPSLNVRADWIDTGGLQPLRVVLDSRLSLPEDAAMLALPGRTIVFCVDDSRRATLERAGATVIRVRAEQGRPELAAVLRELAGMEVNDVLVEAGPTLAGSLVTAGLVDELVIYQAPHIMGSNTRGMLATPAWESLSQRLSLDITDLRRIGSDIRITARPAN